MNEPGDTSAPEWRGESIGQSVAFLDFQERVSRVAPVDRSVLLVGERGTGKELAARRLHFLSRRWQEPFVTLHCAALSPTLIESELFGHEAGAFTGATRRRRGRFETANGGTLFLDEISLIPMETQEKILRVVEYGAFERVGGDEAVHVDVRIIGATNADLSRETERGRFKDDLLDRLSFEVLFLPPLRERGEDILLLARHFATRMAHELGVAGIPELSDAVTERLLRHPWPGNIRELKNVIERAVYRAGGAHIDVVDFHPFQSPFAPPPEERRAQPASEPADAPPPDEAILSDAVSLSNDATPPYDAPLPERVRRLEIEAARRALRESRFHQRRAAERLGLTYDQFRGLYRKYRAEIEE